MWEGTELSEERAAEFAGPVRSLHEPDVRSEPDPELLERALVALTESRGSDQPLRWIIGKRIIRRQSTLFPLHAITKSGAALPAFYKITRRDRGPAERRSREEFSNRVNSLVLTERLLTLSVQEGILPARILAVDPLTRAVITLKAPGRPLGKAVRLLLPGRRPRPREIYRKIGRSIRLIEQCSDPDLRLDDSFWTGQLERLPLRCRPMLRQREIDRLIERLGALHRSMTAAGGHATYAHGDLSNSNVLVHHEGISLIDIIWSVRFPGYDLAYFTLRMRYENPSVRRWTELMIESTIEGYGDPGIRSSPAWQMAHLHRLVGMASRGVRPALVDLKSLVREH